MNRFEQAVQECMKPTEKLLERTTKPLHRAILLNFWRHVHLEGAGEYDKILAPDMMVDRPPEAESSSRTMPAYTSSPYWLDGTRRLRYSVRVLTLPGWCNW